MEIRSIRTPGLGDATYLLSHAGVGLVVDPQRDIDRFLAAIGDLGMKVAYVLETHLHNDYLSGGRELARETGAKLVLPAGSGAAFEHLPAFHQEELGGPAGLRVRPIHTPGHTPEHVSYLVLIDGRPVALFSGGSLLVGSAGRPDLLGPTRARQLARLQYGSVRRLAALPDEVGLFPTHGEGSFCTASGAGRSTSTIGQEKRENPVLAYSDVEAFVEGQLAGLGPYPKYYAQMGPINTLGPTPLPKRPLRELTPTEVAQRPQDVWVVDARPTQTFAAGHLPGAVGLEFGDDFGVWVGWVLPFNAPLVLVLDPDQEAAEAVVQLGRIGFEHIQGVLRGVETWRRAGLPLERYETVELTEFAEAVRSGQASQVLDVRSPLEYQVGHLSGSLPYYVADLGASVPAALRRDEPVWVACASGARAAIAASLLQRAGYQPVLLRGGGIPDVVERLQPAATANR